MIDQNRLSSRTFFWGFITILIFTAICFFRFLNQNEYWAGYVFPWEKLNWIVVSTVIPVLIRVLTITRKDYFSRWLVIGLSLSLVFLVSLCRIDGVIVTLLFLVALVMSQYELGRLTLKLLKFPKVPLVSSFLVGSILFHHLLFLMASFSILQRPFVYSVVAGLTLICLYQIFKSRIEIYERLGTAIGKLDFPNGLLAAWLVAILATSFVALAAPQTHADGVVERLPYLNQILTTGTFPFHFMKWGLLIPLPVNLLLVPGYFFNADLGASLNLFVYVLAFVFTLLSFCKYIGLNSSYALGSVALIMCLPPVWLVSATIYFDIAIALFCLAGLHSVLKAFNESSQTDLFMGFLFWGFAASIKMNAAIFIFCLFLTLLIFYGHRFKFILSNLHWCTLLFLLACLPWGLRVAKITGNPFFPFFGILTKSDFIGTSILNSAATSGYFFDGDLLTFLKFPWSIVFATGRFGEYLPGTFNPIMFCLFVLSLFCLIFLIAKKKLRSQDWALICGSILIIFATSFALKASIFRYWLGGFIVLFLVGMSVIQASTEEWRSRAINILLMFLVPASFAFLLLVGARINYGLPAGQGDELWFGKTDSKKFVSDITLNIPRFINEKIAGEETVFLTQFFYANHVSRPCIYVSDRSSLYGIFNDHQKFVEYVNKYKVRFWVVQPMIPFDMDQRIKNEYWKPENIVFAAGDFIVYDLTGKKALLVNRVSSFADETSGTSWKTNKDMGGEMAITSQNPGWLSIPSPQSAKFLKVDLTLHGVNHQSAGLSTFVGQVIQFDAQGVEISRRLVIRTLSSGRSQVVFYSDADPNTELIKVQVNPWTEKDGLYKIESSEVNFYE